MFKVFIGVRTLALIAVAAVFLPSGARAAESTVLKEVVVTATRVARPVGELVADVTVIDRETLERAGPGGLVDVLSRIPGLEFSRNGGVGNTTSLFLRGGETRHTVVLVDGVRLDTQNTSGGASWSTIPLAQIDRIEVVRGPTSAVYGSDAMAGVIQIFTKKGEAGFSPSIALGFGTYTTQTLDFAASGGAGAWDYSFGISGGQSNGFNIRPIAGQNPDADGYLGNSANLHLGWQLHAAHRLELTALHGRMDAQYDSAQLVDNRSINTNDTQGLQWLAQWTPAYSTRIGVSRGLDQGEDLPSRSNNRTQIDSVLWFNEYKLDQHAFSLTLEQRNDSFQLSGTPRIDRSKSQSGAGLGYAWSAGSHSLQLSARNDVDSEFGAQTSTSAGYGYALTPWWRASVSTATAFRTPTLYQRFSKYGVSTLVPESGRNWELGLNYTEGPNTFGLVVYRNLVSNLLAFQSAGTVSCPIPANGCYSNTASAQYQGVTLSAQRRWNTLTAWASLDLQDPRDGQTGKLLKRRATHHATLGVSSRWASWTVGSDMVLSALRYDDDANATVLPGYVLLNLSAQRPLSAAWTFQARVDNVTDAQYQTANTYATAGRSLYVGLKWAP